MKKQNQNEYEKLEMFFKEYNNGIIKINDIKKYEDITIKPYTFNEKYLFNEEKYYKKINSIIKKLATENKKYNIIISVINRNTFNKIFKQEYLSSNINLMLKLDINHINAIKPKQQELATLYTLTEYLDEEQRLNDIIKNLNISQLSQIEKYIAIYDFVKNYKPYKENKRGFMESRALKYILNNEYMVCVGYSTLLKTLLDKVNIPSIILDVTFYESECQTDTKDLYVVGHQRNLVRIIDKKYNINGIYVSDSTFDNNLDEDLNNNCLLTINQRLKIDGRVKDEPHINFFFDFQSEQDFKKKCNIKELSKLWNTDDSHVHLQFIESILNILIDLDYQQYEYFYNTYLDTINNNIQFKTFTKYGMISNSDAEIFKKDFDNKINQFYEEYCNYVLLTTNNEIDINIIEQIKNRKNIDTK